MSGCHCQSQIFSDSKKLYQIPQSLQKKETDKSASISGGEGGIRTLDELSTHTRVPVVRHKPD